MISYAQALDVLVNSGSTYPISTIEISVEESAGQICAEDIYAPMPNQPFDNSAMDGYAVKFEDLESARKNNSAKLSVVGHIAAGDNRDFPSLQNGQCYEIMTGAKVPSGCTAVVPVEETKKSGETSVEFFKAPKMGEQIRRLGEDIQQGAKIVAKGTPLTSAHILALTTVGVGRVKTLRPIKVGIVSTGTEIVDDYEEELLPGQIYNSTGPYLRSVLREVGVDIVQYGTVSDSEGAFAGIIRRAKEDNCDLIISTGAVSAGTHDFIPSVVKGEGGNVLFHKVAIRPGKPIFFAKFSEHGPFILGLPGNPASTAAGVRFFVSPFLRAMQGLTSEKREYAILAKDYRKGPAKLRFFMRATISHSDKGLRQVIIPAHQHSFKVSPFLHTNAWAVIREDQDFLKEGDLVEICQ